MNILALALRRADAHQYRHLADPGLFGNFGTTGRAITNPTIDTFIKPFGNEIAGMPSLARCSRPS